MIRIALTCRWVFLLAFFTFDLAFTSHSWAARLLGLLCRSPCLEVTNIQKLGLAISTDGLCARDDSEQANANEDQGDDRLHVIQSPL